MDFKIDSRTILSHSTQSSTDRKTRDLASLKQSCRDFEALYAMEMFKAMRKTVPDGGLVKKNSATEMFQEMLDMETAKAATNGPGLGIATAMYEQMADMIENKK